MLHHLDLNVSDLGKSQAFYATLLTRLGYQRGASGPRWITWVSGPF